MRRTITLLFSALLGLSASLLPVGAGVADSGEVAAACVGSPDFSRSQPPSQVVTGDSVPVGLVETDVRWTRWSKRLTYGGMAILEGQVVTDEGALVDVEVDLYALESGASDWARVGSTTSGDDGVFEFPCQQPERNTRYRAVFEGDGVHTESQGEKRVAVMRHVPDRMRARDDGSFVFRGGVRPNHVGGRVLLETKPCKRCRWSSTDTDIANNRSRWRFLVPGPSRGSVFYRAVVPAGDGYARSYSDHVWRLSR